MGADLEFAQTGNARTGVGLGYTISFDIYGNAYGDEYANGTVNWTKSSITSLYPSGITQNVVDTNNTEISEKTSVQNRITPSYSYYVDATSRISVGFTASADIRFGFTTEKTTATNVRTQTDYDAAGVKTRHTTTTATSNSVNSEESTFTIAPSLALGAQFHLIPNRLLLNAGLNIRVFQYKVTTTTNKPTDLQKTVTDTYNANGVLTNHQVSTGTGPIQDQQLVKDSWGNVQTSAGLGLTFQVNEHFSVDGLTTVTVAPFQINVWKTLVEGPYSLYLTLKF
jgi:YD repeat-containing protein